MEQDTLKNIIEAALFVSQKRLTIKHLQALFEAQPEVDVVKQVLLSLTEDYQHRGITLHRTASGYQFQSQTQYTEFLSKLWPERPPRYSRALMETLALIVYKQPITRAEIEAVRGVAASSAIFKTLYERDLDPYYWYARSAWST